ncbi:Uncharacterised protein [Mycobacteroides abscessus]|uniref:hypothetical protein n=1 Tax=Mycobacteroides abscessus TaxID=36809 RepID=UPI0005DF4A9E|nr:hypothetical protein [Mycobacteroides abscessus]CPR38254.1 Uncharacterised protein [Mycobacteroides abscessus]CPR75152.1 Uncharacterised protein [Mycobacteroides abscessus]CPS03292.1 Uncharacterised protein [Mycobacteroides abscessus]CPS08624.1 Uncharacterised protein [Mycobacteroides abscessus]CPS53579.1 Uncharacterised protein [Mycobacteroides abscessus]
MSTWGAADDPGDQYEADRCAIAKLLDARGHAEAAAIVAVSVYRPDLVDNWNGGQYEAVLEVAPELYDQASGEFRDAISSAAEAMIGSDCYQGLRICLLAAAPRPDWVEEVVRGLQPVRVASERVHVAMPVIDATIV